MRPLIIILLCAIPLDVWACVELIENSRVNEMTYNFYADNGADSCVRLPYVRKDFKAEGVHITDKDIAYISMHHKDEKLPSRVVQSDAKTGKVLKTYNLMGSGSRGYMGKVAAISLFDKDTKFVVPSKNSLCIFDKRNATRSMDGTYKAPLIFCQEQSIENRRISFISHAPNNNGGKYIWAVASKPGKKSSKIFGYKILKDKILKVPTYTFSVPKSVSGVDSLAVLKEDKQKYSFLLKSKKGINMSQVYRIDYAYDNKRKKYKHTLTASNFTKSNRKPASLASVDEFIDVKLPKKSPEYLKTNIPTLHQTLQTMRIKNMPMMPPR